MSFDVAMTALLADADRWTAASQGLTTASNAAAALTVPDQSFSFAGGQAASAYEDLRSFVQDFLSDGSAKAAGAASALNLVHRVYAASDEGAKAELEQKWKAL